MTCLVTVRHQKREWDLELPTDIPAARLIEMLIEALQLPGEDTLSLSIEPFGARVAPDHSLASADIYDGTILVLSSGPSEGVKTVTDAVGDSPAVKWKVLAEEASPSPTPVAPEPTKPGYQWKKIGD